MRILLVTFLFVVTEATSPLLPRTPEPPVVTEDVLSTQRTDPDSSSTPLVLDLTTKGEGENAVSPTVDKTETVDQSPGPEDEGEDVTGPRVTTSTGSVFEIDFENAASNTSSLSSSIQVSGIVINIDGIPPSANEEENPTGNPAAVKSPFPLPVAEDDSNISLGPIEMSTLVHQIPSTLQPNSTQDNTSSPTSPYSDNASDIIQYRIYGEAQQMPEDGRLSTHHEESHYHGPLESNDPYAHWDSDSEEQEREMELQRFQDVSGSEENLEDADIRGNTLEEGEAAEELGGSLQEVEGLEEEEEEEEERVKEDMVVEQEKKEKEPSTAPLSTSDTTNGRSYLLLLAGNSTIVRLRQEDFAKYLKLNLAARLSLEYDDVRVNRVVLAPPQLLVNVSVVTPSNVVAVSGKGDEDTKTDRKGSLLVDKNEDEILQEEGPLHMLAETNATLLELSGEEYHVVRLLPLHSQDEKQQLEETDAAPVISNHHADIEVVIYTIVGGACVLIILATLLVILGRHPQCPWQKPKSFYSSWSLPTPSHLRHRRMIGGDDRQASTTSAPTSHPTVIYSGTFAARAATGSWVDEYQTQPQDSGGGGLLGSKLYTDLEMGGTTSNVIMGHNSSLGRQYAGSPSKLHIFSCKPGSILIPPSPTQARRQRDTHPLEDRLGHDNPNYQT